MEEDANNQADRLTCLCTVVSLFPQPPCHHPGGSCARQWGRRSRMCSARPTWLRPLLCAQPASRGQHRAPSMAPSSRMIGLLLGGRLIDYTGPLPPWKGRCFVLTGIDAPSGYNLAKTSTHELADVLFPSRSCTQLGSQQGIYFIVNETEQWILPRSLLA